jgi:hypothetical protein
LLPDRQASPAREEVWAAVPLAAGHCDAFLTVLLALALLLIKIIVIENNFYQQSPTFAA